MNYIISIIMASLLSMGMCSHSKNIEFIEDAYTMQAPETLVEQAEKIATLTLFDAPYELTIPKKAGMQINPWNRFIGCGTNPQTKRPFLVVNPEWFAAANPDEQDFLIARNFVTLQVGKPWGIQFIPIIISLLWTILAVIALTALLKKIQCISLTRWMRVIAALSIVIMFNMIVTQRIIKKVQIALLEQHVYSINNRTIELFNNNTEVATRALRYLDTSIKEQIKQGEQFFAPFENEFENQIRFIHKMNTIKTE